MTVSQTELGRQRAADLHEDLRVGDCHEGAGREAPSAAGPQAAPARASAGASPAAWTLGRPPADYTIRHVRAVLADRILDDAEAVVRDGRIAAVRARGSRSIATGGASSGGERIVVDGRGLLLAPGFIDVHSDALEKEQRPRPNAEMPAEFALASFEGRAAGAGITTMFHGAGFQHQVARGNARSVRSALRTCAVVDGIASDRMDHRVLHRLDILSEEGAAALRERLGSRPAGAVLLVSHEDHTPGQGQYADPAYMRDYLISADGMTEAEADERLVRLEREGREKAAVREANFAWLGELAAAGRIRLLGHDPDSAAAVEALHARGGAVAEFPTTLEAAVRARELGMPIVAGGPNAVRGQSHSGNVSVRELVAAGLVDALASDYMPTTLLAGVHVLVRGGVLDLPQALRLITEGPARVAGLHDRGRLEEGLRADFALVDDRLGAWPRVAGTLLSAGTGTDAAETAEAGA
ncbi:alpha-D-ribose 1-methylphosphonate 5-triphosphate diphosphatase [Brevibacterium album]|uniref:alpha-D-ribose 1-methylphosphonate 5-triphosphate diphosphatase n=1 Tax=Brevibacterium album TaxID=417948 RepID=UPI0004006FC9|nr:alpha-D-ribose 1-methylphosphonate 5-triphosphate diphosphatase [Brevibacterium album]